MQTSRIGFETPATQRVCVSFGRTPQSTRVARLSLPARRAVLTQSTGDYLIKPSAFIAALTAGRAATRSWNSIRCTNLDRSSLSPRAHVVRVNRYASATVDVLA